MVEYKFTKDGIKEMYRDTCTECFEALSNGTINEMSIEIKMGNQVVRMPMFADNLETVFAAIEECLENS